MQANHCLDERLNEEYKRDLMQQAEKARQAQAAQIVKPGFLEKLRLDLMSLNKKSQDEAQDKHNH
jgi:hypothetical protein